MIKELEKLIICPKCLNYIHIKECTISMDVIQGKGFCLECPLDVFFTYSKLSKDVTVSAFKYHLKYKVDDNMCQFCEESTNKLFVVMNKGVGEGIVAIFTNKQTASRLCQANTKLEIRIFDCEYNTDHHDMPFNVFVVSIGSGKRYRIIDIGTDRKKAIKIATSIRGKVANFEAMPSLINHADIVFYKWFIPLEKGENEQYFYVDSFRKKVSLYEKEKPTPIVTRRRRYSPGLPYRLEVSGSSQNNAGSISKNICEQIEKESFRVEDLEYNVDYPLEEIDGIWKLKEPNLELV